MVLMQLLINVRSLAFSGTIEKPRFQEERNKLKFSK